MLLDSWDAVSGTNFSTLVRAIGLRTFFFLYFYTLASTTRLLLLHTNKDIFKSYCQRDVITTIIILYVSINAFRELYLNKHLCKISNLESLGWRKHEDHLIQYSFTYEPPFIYEQRLLLKLFFGYKILHNKKEKHKSLIFLENIHICVWKKRCEVYRNVHCYFRVVLVLFIFVFCYFSDKHLI